MPSFNSADISEGIYFSVGHFKSFNIFPKQALVCRCRQYRSSENTVGKGEIARYE